MISGRGALHSRRCWHLIGIAGGAYFGGGRIARRDISSGNVYYIFADRLGSYRTLTDSTGNVKGESDYNLFGGERVFSSTVTDSFRFAGMEWDSEDGLYHTLYRQYTPAQGRWEAADPKRGCPRNPQNLDRYPYVTNNPTNSTDPLGDPIACEPGCSIYDASCCTECDPWYDPGCGGGFAPGGGGGGGGGGGPITCGQSCCDPETYDPVACSGCALDCPGSAGGGGTGGGGGGGEPVYKCNEDPKWIKDCAEKSNRKLCKDCCNREASSGAVACLQYWYLDPIFLTVYKECMNCVTKNVTKCRKGCDKVPK